MARCTKLVYNNVGMTFTHEHMLFSRAHWPTEVLLVASLLELAQRFSYNTLKPKICSKNLHLSVFSRLLQHCVAAERSAPSLC